MPTFHFLLYLASIGVAWIFRLAYVGWFGRYLLAAAITVPLLLLLLSLPSMLALRLELGLPESCVRGEENKLCIGFNTGSLLPLSLIKLQLEIENRFTGQRSRKTYKFRSILSCDGTLPLPTADCGLLVCRVRSWECYDLLGMVRIRRREVLEASCAVLPQAVEPPSPPNIGAAVSAGVRLKPKYGGGYSEEHELRPYRPGDMVNSIHWKLSSKTDSLIVREPLVCENNEIFLVFTGKGDLTRGLETLYWMSLELCRMELAHTVVGPRQFAVTNEAQAREAVIGLLSSPPAPPCPFNRAMARCVFLVSGQEVKL